MDLAEYYQEVTKTAGLIPGVDNENEKIAAVVAVSEQFDIDEIEFDSEDEKIAAAVAIVEGFCEEVEKEAGKGGMFAKIKKKLSGAGSAAKKHLMKHKGKYGIGAGAAGTVGGFAAGRASKD